MEYYVKSRDSFCAPWVYAGPFSSQEIAEEVMVELAKKGFEVTISTKEAT